MNVSRREFVKKLLLFIMVAVLAVSYTAVVFANPESPDVIEQASESLEEAEFDEEQVPLSSVPGAADDDATVVTPFNVISAIGSYSLLIPAVLLAAIALIIAAIFRRKEKAATAK